MGEQGFSTFVEYAPGCVVENADLPYKFSNIVERTGIVARHHAFSQDTIEAMGIEVVRALYHRLGICGRDCSGLVLATTCLNEGDRQAATRAARVIAAGTNVRVGLHAIGVNYACSGFTAATAKAISIARGQADDRHVLVVTAERMSDIVDFCNEDTAILFGDRAAATSIAPGGHPIFLARACEMDDDDRLLSLERMPDAVDKDGRRSTRTCLAMHGKALYKRVPGDMIRLVRSALAETGIPPDQLTTIVHHQANGRFAKRIAQGLVDEGMGHVRVVDQIARMGNVGSSSIPCALAQELDALPDGGVVACPAVGAGCDIARGKLTEGIVLFRVSRE